MRKIIHIDMDAFFASIETVCNPSLKGKPIIVCGNPEGRTAVASASYETREFGVKAGMGLTEALKLCPKAILVEGTPSKYITTSLKLLKKLSKYSDLLEIFSIDEAFIDVTDTKHLFGGARTISKEIKEYVVNNFSVTCSIGIAPNKLLAKLASGFTKPDGLSEIQPEDVSKTLENIPVQELCGIGEKTGEVLSRLGIKTCGELGRFDVRKLERVFGKGGRVIHDMGLGVDRSSVRPYYYKSETKSFGHTMTLQEDTRDLSLILRHLLQLSEQVGRRLRKENYTGKTITVVIRYENFETHTRQKTFDFHFDEGFSIYRVAKSIFLREFDRNRFLRLIGVSVSNLVKGKKQEELFKIQEKESLMRTLDDINDKYGEFTVTRGSILYTGRKQNIVPFGLIKQKGA